SAQGEAALVAGMVGTGQAGLITEKVVGIKGATLPEPPPGPVKGIGAALQGHVDHGAAVAAELRGKSVALHLEFLHRFHRRLVIDVGVAALALLRSADEDAVEPHLRRGIALPVRDKIRAGGIDVRSPRPRGFTYPGVQKDQAKETAVQQRNLFYILIRDV